MRVNAYIDGFNLYHAICCSRHPGLAKYRWANYRQLISHFLHPNDKLQNIYYFTALAHWDEAKQKRHIQLVAALKSVGVEVIPGRFQEVTKNCRACFKDYETFEEKHTDVNIAVHLLKHGIQDRFDKAVVVSGDSDLVPAFKALNELCPDKKLEVILPPNALAEEIRSAVFRASQIKEIHLKSSQFPDEVQYQLKPGVFKTARKPDEWK